MSFLSYVLDPPSYGFQDSNGNLYQPSRSEIFREFFSRLNIFKTRKHWLPFFVWITTLGFAVPLGIFLIYFFSWPLLILGFFYSMVVMGCHGTFWLHRYSTHQAFKFRAPWIRELCRNLVIKVIPEETYVVSHWVHHRFPEKPGDPYNVHAGWLYCFLADANHQNINPNLTESDYDKVCKQLKHTGVRLNSYASYRKWGTVCHPFYTVIHYAANWLFWYTSFYLLGGHALATALFGSAGVWAVGVRTFNYEGHGKGKDLRRTGVDFNPKDLSINQLWPGFVAGEWHNNHHLYPNGAQSGFLRYQLDLPWHFIRLLQKVGAVHSVKNYKKRFFEYHYWPHYQKASPSK